MDAVLFLSRLDEFRVDASDVQASTVPAVSSPFLCATRYITYCSEHGDFWDTGAQILNVQGKHKNATQTCKAGLGGMIWQRPVAGH